MDDESTLTAAQQSAIVRLFSDEELIEAIVAICTESANDYKNRAYHQLIEPAPQLLVCTRHAHLASAFESLPGLLQAEFDKINSPEKES